VSFPGLVGSTAVSKSQFQFLHTEPKIMTPQHDYSLQPLQLFWFDPIALQAIAGSKREMSLLAQVIDDDQDADILYPLKQPAGSIADFKTTPSIHAGYAATWFGLSGAGFYMTKKLITRGRA
jgi:hypothetical protein